MRCRFALVLALAAVAQPSAGRAAESFGVSNEVLLTVKGKVVDLTCELTHECVPNCGAGKRQLGLLTSEGKLFVAAKSSTIFAGLAHDLIASCGQEIIADGLTTTNFGSTLLMIQRFKTAENADWIEANKFAADWARLHSTDPAGKQTEEWYRNDWVVKRAVAQHGQTGVPE